MKLKFRAEKKDVVAFVVVALFVFLVIAFCVANVTSIVNDGVPAGINIFKAFE